MPGPKIKHATVAGDGLSVVSAVDVVPESNELPSMDGYITVVNKKTRLPDGTVRDDVERTWQRRPLMKWLSLCPKAQVHIRSEGAGDPTGKRKPRPYPVYYDGIRIDIPVGTPQMVALPIAEIVWQSQQEYRTAQVRGVELYLIDPEAPDDHGLEVPGMAG